MIKTIPQAIDDMAVSLGASPSAEIPTVAQALENVYTALGGDRTDLDTLVLPEVIDLVAPLIQGGGGGGGYVFPVFTADNPSAPVSNMTFAEIKSLYEEYGDTAGKIPINISANDGTDYVFFALYNRVDYDYLFEAMPDEVAEAFFHGNAVGSGAIFAYADDDKFYISNGSH